MIDLDRLHADRLRRWCQTPETRIPDPDAATRLIDRVGIATLYPASSEIPNLFHAYVGDPEAVTQSEWDSPSGHVYTWRWELGRREAAYYGVIVRKRPTWVSWSVLPAVLRVYGELRTPDELFDLGAISSDAYAIAQALESCGGALGTGELRRVAGFPTGKERRAAYLKAVEELDTRLMLAKVFSTEDEEMRHALVSVRYAEYVDAAEAMSRDEAMHALLAVYLKQARYAVPRALARHLKLSEEELRAALDRLVEEGQAMTVSGADGPYVSIDADT